MSRAALAVVRRRRRVRRCAQGRCSGGLHDEDRLRHDERHPAPVGELVQGGARGARHRRIEVKLFRAASWHGREPDRGDAARHGRSRSSRRSTSSAGVGPAVGTFSIPVLFKDPVHAQLLDPQPQQGDPDPRRRRAAGGVRVHLRVRALLPQQPIRKLNDFKGKKLRVNATAAKRAKMRQFGASAVDLAEVVPDQQGVIDGTMSATAVYVNLKFNDVGEVLTQVNTMIVSAAAGRGSPSCRPAPGGRRGRQQLPGPHDGAVARALDDTMRKRRGRRRRRVRARCPGRPGTGAAAPRRHRRRGDEGQRGGERVLQAPRRDRAESSSGRRPFRTAQTRFALVRPPAVSAR